MRIGRKHGTLRLVALFARFQPAIGEELFHHVVYKAGLGSGCDIGAGSDRFLAVITSASSRAT